MLYLVKDKQNKETQQLIKLFVDHDEFEKLNSNKILIKKQNFEIYYHKNRKNNTVNDVLNPYRYQKILDNNMF